MATGAVNRTLKLKRFNVFNVATEIQADLWTNEKLSGGVEMALLLFVWGRTWANRTSREEDMPEWTEPISNRKLGKEANCSTDMAQRSMARMRAVGIIASDPQDDRGGKPLRYKLLPENWVNVPKYEPKLAPVVLIAEPEEEAEPEDDKQEVIPGMEHLFVQASKPAVLGVHRRLENLRMNVDANCDVKPGWEGADLCLTITYRGDGNRQVKQDTSALHVGGHKLSDARFLKVLMDGIADRGLEVERALGVKLMRDLGSCREIDFLKYAFETLDEKCAKELAKGKKYRREWLPDWAKTVSERWPQAKKRRAAGRAEALKNPDQALCHQCGMLGSFCECSEGQRDWRAYDSRGRVS